MKQLQAIFLLLLLVTIGGCATMNTGSKLTGKWRLTETLADPGDGSGKWKPVESDESYLTFDSEGGLSSTDSPGYRSYALVDSNKIEISFADGRKQVMTYHVDGSTLTLSPQCIEACGSRYTRVN
jgi:hypothetical protein